MKKLRNLVLCQRLNLKAILVRDPTVVHGASSKFLVEPEDTLLPSGPSTDSTQFMSWTAKNFLGKVKNSFHATFN